MNTKSIKYLLVVSLVTVASLSVSSQTTALIPANNLAYPEAISNVTISEDGKTIAYTVFSAEDNISALALREVRTGKVYAVQPQGNIYAYTWTGEGRILYQGDGGFASVSNKGESYNGVTGFYRKLDGHPALHYQTGYNWFRLLGSETQGHEILVLEFDRNKGAWGYIASPLYTPDVASLNEKTGALNNLVENPGHIIRWLADRSGVVRIGIEIRSDEKSKIYCRNSNDTALTVLPGCDFTDTRCEPIALSGDGKTLYIRKITNEGCLGIYSYNLETKKQGELIAGDATYDMENLVFDRNRSTVLGAEYDADLPKVIWFDKLMQQIQLALDEKLPGKTNRITSMSGDRQQMVVASASASTPTSYYLYDATTANLTLLFNDRPWLNPEQLAEVSPIHYNTRDGQRIEGYLTVPRGPQQKKLPLVLLVNHWPNQRATWKFDPYTQFLANRGYAVLEINFRGSSGYGEAFRTSAHRQWGTLVQQDIEDAAQWAISTQLADPARIAISNGTSDQTLWSLVSKFPSDNKANDGFGGYCATMGLIRTPDLYRCAINIGGITDWVEFLKERRRVDPWGYDMITGQIGTLETNASAIANMSPATQTNAIKAPVLLAYGQQSDAVPFSQAKDFVRKLKKSQKPCETFFKLSENNNFPNWKSRKQLYETIVSFLDKNLNTNRLLTAK